MIVRRAPNWEKPGDSVEGIWKEDLLRELGDITGINILIETGTCEGSTIFALRNDFEEIHSIELSPHFFNISTKRLSQFSNISLYQGNSGKLLGALLDDLRNEPTIFWLDAHSSGGLTADEGDPLADELKAIMTKRPDSLVIIDDMADNSLLHTRLDFTGWIREYRTGEIIMYKEGMYDIPPFEE